MAIRDSEGRRVREAFALRGPAGALLAIVTIAAPIVAVAMLRRMGM